MQNRPGPVTSPDDLHGFTFRVLTLNCWGLRLIARYRAQRLAAIAHYIRWGPHAETACTNVALRRENRVSGALNTTTDSALVAKKMSSNGGIEFEENLGSPRNTSYYHFVFLQEVWMTSDYERLVDALQDILPYSKRFASGVIGSGLCVFSTAPIDHFFFVPFAANGYFYKVWHGDWFSGKGVGICQVRYRGLQFQLITTHTHVETARDEYRAQRVTQALCLVDLVLLATTGADVVIVAGDLNSQPNGVLAQLICRLAGLDDCFDTAQTISSHPSLLLASNTTATLEEKDRTWFAGTCNIPANAFSTPVNPRAAKQTTALTASQGWRLDYILYRNCKPQKGKLVPLVYTRPFPSRIPGQATLSFSDHEAVAVTFRYIWSSKTPTFSVLGQETRFAGQNGTKDEAFALLSERQEDTQDRGGGFSKAILFRGKSKRDAVVSEFPAPSTAEEEAGTLPGSDQPREPASQSHNTEGCDQSARAISLQELACFELNRSCVRLRRQTQYCVVAAVFLLVVLLGTLYVPVSLPWWGEALCNFFRILFSCLFCTVGLIVPVQNQQEIRILQAALLSLKEKSPYPPFTTNAAI